METKKSFFSAMFGRLVRVTVLYVLLLLAWAKCLSIPKANATFDQTTSISIMNSGEIFESNVLGRGVR